MPNGSALENRIFKWAMRLMGKRYSHTIEMARHAFCILSRCAGVPLISWQVADEKRGLTFGGNSSFSTEYDYPSVCAPLISRVIV